MDDNASRAAQEAQDAQKAAINNLVELLASLIGQLSNREVKPTDLTLMSGTKKAWPSDNPDLELTAKVQDAFTNPDNKASIRIFLEYPDGRKEQIFRQVQGKIPPGGDPLGLAPAMREMFAKQAADKFTAEQRPKVVIETDSQTVTQKPTVFEALAKTVSVVAETMQNKAEPVNDSAADSVEQSEAMQPSEEKNQILKELAVVEKSLVNARNNLGSPDFDPVEAQQWVDYFEQKAQSLRAQLGIAEPAAAAVAPVQNTQAVKDTAAVEPVQKPEIGQPSSKEQMLKGQLEIVDEALDDANRRANTPGFEYLRGEPWFKDLETKAQSLRAQLGIAEPAAAAIAQVQNTQAVTESATVEAAQVQLENTEAVAEPALKFKDLPTRQQYLSIAETFTENPTYTGLTDVFENYPESAKLTDYMVGSIALESGLNLSEVQKMLEESPSRNAIYNDVKFQAHVAQVIDQLRGQGIAINQEKTVLTTVPNAKSFVYESWIPSFPELAEVGALAKYEGETLDINPVEASSSDIEGAFNNVAIQPFLAEVTQLSAEIESLRTQTNQHLGDIALFTQTLGQSINEPQIQQWTQETAAAVEVHSQTLGDRLRNAAAGLLETVKDHAANDWKIVVDTVKERASDDWAKTVEVVQDRAATDWEKLQRWSISSDQVDAGIDTLIHHVGENSAGGGLAEQDGYVFARKGEERAIFRTGTNEPVYKNGLLTDSANSKDSAYITGFPSRVEKAAAVADAIAQTSAKSSAPSAGRVR